MLRNTESFVIVTRWHIPSHLSRAGDACRELGKKRGGKKRDGLICEDVFLALTGCRSVIFFFFLSVQKTRMTVVTTERWPGLHPPVKSNDTAPRRGQSVVGTIKLSTVTLY